jgi:peptidoglycan/xylan/chitin deacetylase (PgdA/CDA1 family)
VKLPGKKSLQKSFRWLRSRFVSHALILGYHRVAEALYDPYSLCVSPENFYEQMQVLQKYASPLTLDELIDAQKQDQLPERAAALTFDDGYVDILYHAKPVLEELHIPFTVFVVSGNLGKEFWWDELARIILDAGSSTEELHLRINAQEYSWILNQTLDDTERRKVLFSIFRVLKSLPADLRQEQLGQIRTWAGSSSNVSAYSRGMTSDELESLIQGGLVDIGVHGITHTDLALLSPDQYGSEIARSKAQLERMIDKSVHGFSYPYGSFTQEIKDTVREVNYEYACASFNDVVWRGSDLFALPRYWIPDIDGQQFYRWVKTWV